MMRPLLRYFVLMLLASSTSLLGQRVDPTTQEKTHNTSPDSPLTVRVHDLVGLEVEHGASGRVGTIHDLLIDPASGKIHALLVDCGNAEEARRELRVLPAASISIESRKGDKESCRARTTLTPEQVKSAPVVMKGEALPDDIVDRIERKARKPERATSDRDEDMKKSGETCHLVKAQDLAATTLKTKDGKTVGTISELVVAPAAHTVAYAVVKTKEASKDREIALPWSCIHAKQTEKNGKFDLTTEVAYDRFAKAPAYDRNDTSSTSARPWLTEMHEYYSAKPFWNSERMNDTDMAARNDREAQDRNELLVSADHLDNTTLRGNSEVDLGEVGDLLVHGETGEIVFVLVDVGGFIGLAEDERVIPWNKLVISADEDDIEKCRCRTSMTKEEIAKAPKIPAGEIDARTMMDQVRKTMGMTGNDDHRRHEVSGNLLRLSAMRDCDLEDREGKNIGEIEDLFIATGSGRIAYAVVDAKNEVGGRTIAISRSRLTFQVKDEEVFAKTTAERSKFKDAPEFDGDNWKKITGSAWVNEVARHFDTEPYWSEKSNRDMRGDRSHRDQNAEDRNRRDTANRRDDQDRRDIAFCSSKDLFGTKLATRDRDDYGQIRDLVVNQKTGEIRYAVVSAGSRSDESTKSRALPWDRVEVKMAEGSRSITKVKTQLSAEEANARPEFRMGSDEMDSDRNWSEDERNDNGETPVRVQGEQSGRLVRSETLIGVEAKDPSGEKVGTIKELILAPSEDRVALVVVSTSKDSGSRTIALPWDAIRIEKNADRKTTVSTRFTTARLKDAPAHDRDVWASNSSRQYLEELARFHETPSLINRRDRRSSRSDTLARGDNLMLVGHKGIIGVESQNSKGETVARIENALFTTPDGNLEFAVLSSKTNRDSDDDLCVVPWGHLKVGNSESDHAKCVATTALEEGQLEKAPAYKQSEMHRISDIETKTNEVFGESDTVNRRYSDGGCFALSELENVRIMGPSSQHVGTIERAMIDPHQACVAYVVVKPAETGAGQLVAIPWDCISISRNSSGEISAFTEIDRQKIAKAPTFSTTDLQTMSSKAWVEKMSASFSTKPYWQRKNTSETK